MYGPPPFPGTGIRTTVGRSRGRFRVRSCERAGSASGLVVGLAADRADEPQVGELALDDRLDLLGQVRLAGRRARARRCSRPPPRRRTPRAPAARCGEPLRDTPLRWKYSSWKSRMRRRPSGVSVAATTSGRCSHHPARARRRGRRPRRAAPRDSRAASRNTNAAAIASTSPTTTNADDPGHVSPRPTRERPHGCDTSARVAQMPMRWASSSRW